MSDAPKAGATYRIQTAEGMVTLRDRQPDIERAMKRWRPLLDLLAWGDSFNGSIGSAYAEGRAWDPRERDDEHPGRGA